MAVWATAILCVGTFALLPFAKFSVDLWFFPKMAVGIGVLQALVPRYRRQEEWGLVASLHGASLLAVFTTVYAISQYLLPGLNPRFWDAEIAQVDAFMGLTADDVVVWTRQTKWLDAVLAKVYYVFFFQFALFVPYAAGVRRDPWRSYEMLANMFVCALLGLVLFGFFPAKNAVFFYGHEDIYHTETLVRHLEMLAAGTFEYLSHGNAQGLIQFPSFHVAIAVLLCWDLRYERRGVFAVGVVWTLLMAWSAVTTGGHYILDIWGGCGIAIAAVMLVRWLCGSKPEH